jgi:hypothetical protein
MKAHSVETKKSGNRILLDFGSFALPAQLLDTRIANKFFECLPAEAELTAWGDELYGSIGADLGSENPQPEMPPGGIAYSTQGAYLCIFFGQKPAWPVEFIGMIEGEEWQRLKQEQVSTVTVKPQP